MSSSQYDLLYKRAEYLQALMVVDSIIAAKQQGLPRNAYFDRYLSKQDRKKAQISRAEIYDLTWKKIQLLEHAGSVTSLNHSLRSYKKQIGYHQEEAKALYHQLNKQ